MKTLIRILHSLVSFFVLIIILVLIGFMLAKVVYIINSIWENRFLDPQRDAMILHEIAYAIVFVKAYKILLSYLKSHHLNIKYLIEIAIIAPAIEVIFNSQMNSIFLTTIFAIFATANLLIYLIFLKKIEKINQQFHKKDYEPFRAFKDIIK